MSLARQQDRYAASRCPRVVMRPASYWHWRFENHLSTPVLFPLDWR